MAPDQRSIVVGVDGSEPSARALRWALCEAAVRGDEVVALTAFQVPLLGTCLLYTSDAADE